MTAFAIRLDFGLSLRDGPAAARKVGEILARPCFASLDRVSGRWKARRHKHAKLSADTITAYLLEPKYDAVSLDNRGKELLASGEVENGYRNRTTEPAATRFFAFLAIPFDDAHVAATLQGVRDLAAAIEAGAGFVALGPNHGLASDVAHEGLPKAHPGLSDRRTRERKARPWKWDLLDTHLAGVEWGTFLGPGHLSRVEASTLRASGAFQHVVEVSPRLVFLQLTSNPADDLTEGIEQHLQRAREVLAPLLIDLSDLPANP